MIVSRRAFVTASVETTGSLGPATCDRTRMSGSNRLRAASDDAGPRSARRYPIQSPIVGLTGGRGTVPERFGFESLDLLVDLRLAFLGAFSGDGLPLDLEDFNLLAQIRMTPARSFTKPLVEHFERSAGDRARLHLRLEFLGDEVGSIPRREVGVFGHPHRDQ